MGRTPAKTTTIAFILSLGINKRTAAKHSCSERIKDGEDCIYSSLASPGPSKSTFTRWLVSEHGYVRCPSAEEPDPTFFDEIDRARKTHKDVVIDYGFPLGQLNRVRSLIASDIEPWWFDGDRDTALQVFLARMGHPERKPNGTHNSIRSLSAGKS